MLSVAIIHVSGTEIPHYDAYQKEIPPVLAVPIHCRYLETFEEFYHKEGYCNGYFRVPTMLHRLISVCHRVPSSVILVLDILVVNLVMTTLLSFSFVTDLLKL